MLRTCTCRENAQPRLRTSSVPKGNVLTSFIHFALWMLFGITGVINATVRSDSWWWLPTSLQPTISPVPILFLRGAAAFSCLSAQLTATSTTDLTAVIDRCNFNNNFTHDISSLSLYADPSAPSKHFTLTGNTESATFVNWAVVLAPSFRTLQHCSAPSLSTRRATRSLT